MLISALCLWVPQRSWNWDWERSGAVLCAHPGAQSRHQWQPCTAVARREPGQQGSWAVQLNQGPGGGPTQAELGAWEIGISRLRAKTGGLEGCVEQGMGSCDGGGQGLEDPAFEEWGVLRLALDSGHQIYHLVASF